MKRMGERGRGRAARARPSESIESRENRWLKRFRAALSGDGVQRRGETSDLDGEIAGVEGVRLVESALCSGVEILSVLFSESGAKHLSRLAPLIPSESRLLRTSDRLFASASGTETPQGLAALVRPRVGTLDDLLSGGPLVLVLTGVHDPGNVGTLMRTGDAFRASGIAASAPGPIATPHPHPPKALP